MLVLEIFELKFASAFLQKDAKAVAAEYAAAKRHYLELALFSMCSETMTEHNMIARRL